MKTEELYKRLDVFKDKIRQRLVELTEVDRLFPGEKKEEKKGKLRSKHKILEEDFHI